MSKIEKLKKKFYEKPVRNDITMAEVVKLAGYYGCEVLTGGNHQIKICHRESGTIIPIPQHGSTVKEAYIAELKILFSGIEEQRKER